MLHQRAHGVGGGDARGSLDDQPFVDDEGFVFPLVVEGGEGVPAPAAPHVRALRGNICSSWISSSWLYSLGKESLLKIRGDSTLGQFRADADCDARIKNLTVMLDARVCEAALQRLHYRKRCRSAAAASTWQRLRKFIGIMLDNKNRTVHY